MKTPTFNQSLDFIVLTISPDLDDDDYDSYNDSNMALKIFWSSFNKKEQDLLKFAYNLYIDNKKDYIKSVTGNRNNILYDISCTNKKKHVCEYKHKYSIADYKKLLLRLVKKFLEENNL